MDGNLDVTESTQQEIGLEIAALEERIRALRSQFNARATISRFPAEVVTKIFSWVQQFRGDIFSQIFNPSVFIQWIKVTHVSREWRRIALASRKLWCIIPVRRIWYALEALKRSGSVPLLIIILTHIGKLSHDDEELWQQIVAASPRIRLLRLGGQSHLKDFKQPLPLLENLHFEGGKEVPRNLLSTPLNHLSLDLCSFDWNHLGFDKLTMLKVTNPKQKISYDEFTRLLKSMPRLVGLELGSIFEEPGYRTQHPTLVELIGSDLPPPSLNFPILSSFRASGTSSPAYIQLLAQMTFQPQFSLNLTYKPSRYNYRDLVLVLQILNRVIRNSSMTIRAVRCYSADNPAHNVICFVFSFDPRLGSPFVTFTVEVVLLPWHSFNYGRWLRELALFPLDDVTFLSTEGLSRLDSWTDNLFTGLSNLRRLQLLDHGDVLLVFLISDSNLTTGAIAFPALEELEIHDIHFPIELKSALPRCFIARETRYARLRELTFVGCKVTDAAAKKLEGQVDKLRRISIEAHQQEQRLHS